MAKNVEPTSEQTGDEPRSLFRNDDFMRLWGGETLSQVGSQVSKVALPLTAIVVLDARPGEVGLIGTAQFAPILLISLFAGQWLDRHRIRPAMTAAHLGRAALMALVPILHLLGLLTMGLLLALTFAVGALTAFFDIAYVSYLPKLVSRRQLVEGNAKLESTYSIAAIGGPGLGGVLVQALTAPLAICANVVTYAIAGILSLRIRHRDRPEGERNGPTGSAWRDIREGVANTLRHPVLRPMVLQSACFNLFAQVVFTLFLLHGVRNLGLPSGLLGVILATGSAGGLIGTWVAGRIAQRWGVGRTLVWSMALAVLPLVLVPAARGVAAVLVLFLVTGLVLHGFGLAVFNVHSLSVRARLTAPGELARVTATYRFVSNGTLPFGGLLGGLLAEALGVRVAMLIALGALAGCCALFALSRIRRFTLPPEDVDAVEG